MALVNFYIIFKEKSLSSFPVSRKGFQNDDQNIDDIDQNIDDKT